MAENIYNTPITVYHGHSYNPDGTVVPFMFSTAWFDNEDIVGNFEFVVDDNGNVDAVGSLGNAIQFDYSIEYRNYCEWVLDEAGFLPESRRRVVA